MASAVNGLSNLAASTTAAPQTSTNSNTDTTSAQAPTEQMFLQLLVAQMKNQDPESPSDPTAFVAELAQFSELEQVIGIRSDIEAAGIGQKSTTGTNTSTNAATNTSTASNTNPTSTGTTN